MKRTMATELAAAQHPAHAAGAGPCRCSNSRAGDQASHQRRHLDPELAPWSPDTLGTWPARPNQIELTDGRQCWVRLLIFVVPGPAGPIGHAEKVISASWRR
jgi:hypothetical protein